MPLYESVFIARQDIAAPQVEALTDNMESIVKDKGGSVEKREYWGLRALAYKIKKNRKGHYILLNINGPSEAIHEMERQMRINEDVIRYLTVRKDQLEAEPSIIMRSRNSEERPKGESENDEEKLSSATEKEINVATDIEQINAIDAVEDISSHSDD